MKELRLFLAIAVLASLAISAFGAPAPAPVEAGGEIAVIVKTGNSSFWQNVQTGAMDAQKELRAKSPKLSVTFLGGFPRAGQPPTTG